MPTFKCPHCQKPLEVGKHRGPESTFDQDQALGLLRFGATVKEVAETFGVSRARIDYLRRTRL